ncbi:hypothetical protein MO867_13435 [Microbulbifer sp. OS29]|uniref:Uncharacterized protein n=1 Tax=Microbulbifer okhotskensis TaxID=2926617 RepID=A0A9X2EPF4_9GAMM|nr:hypothetical protein [Microbulbifer okhotskensis]MCO1335335.1 hypothetical protein [Microbulbifer okhotskensis]
MAKGKVINLKNRAQVLSHLFAEVEINGRVLEMGVEVASDLPMIIDWERRVAWVGTWEDLLGDIANILAEESDYAAAAN